MGSGICSAMVQREYISMIPPKCWLLVRISSIILKRSPKKIFAGGIPL